MGYYVKKSEVKKLKYNTLSKVEKKYKEIKSNMFDYSGFDTETFEELQKSVYMIFQSHIVESKNAIEKMPKVTSVEQEKYQTMCEMLAVVISVRDLFQYLNDKARN